MISDLRKRIIYIGLLWNGACHDFTIFKKELQHLDFSDKRIWVDLGFNGIKKKVKHGVINIPHKKPKGGELTDHQKTENKAQSSVRVAVENSISGIKRHFILRHECRLRLWSKINDALEACAGLYNFKLSLKCVNA